VEDLQNQGAKALIFDLRDNAGGQMDVAVNCIDQLVPEADIVFAEDKNGEQTLLGSSDENYVDLPMVVLVNSGTASTAELFAASLRQLSGAQLVGGTTAGKGTIQADPYRMSDGSAVVITTAKMLTSDKTSFDGAGLTVDVEVAAKADGSDTTLVGVEEDTQVQKAEGVAQTMTGGTASAGTDATSAASGDASASQSTGEGGETTGESTDASTAAESTAQTDGTDGE